MANSNKGKIYKNGEKISKMKVEQLVVPECKEVLKIFVFMYYSNLGRSALKNVFCYFYYSFYSHFQ